VLATVDRCKELCISPTECTPCLHCKLSRSFDTGEAPYTPSSVVVPDSAALQHRSWTASWNCSRRDPNSSAPDPAADFRAALAALSAGDQTRAAARFSAFLANHPRDPRAEDAAYLRVIALQRSGDPLTTKAAARDYLRRYPHGFRRAEVAPLAE
jgi:Outer membrane lipoprotein